MLLVRRLVWDSWNVAHIARHGVLPEEVEHVCQSDPVVQAGKKGRLLVFGPTPDGRVLAVVLDGEPETGTYYPVTARLASRRERAIFAKEREGETL
jgi:uncharacterized DUF497 family protein